jgi:ABC-type Fe3+-siderophore transport system permease subunit
MARMARGRVLLGSGAAYATFATVFFTTSLPFTIPRVEAVCRQAPPDVRFAPSATDVLRFLDACGVAGRESYRNLQLADLAYPAVFGLFLATALAFVISRLTRPDSRLLALSVLPLLGAAFDYLENACAWLALAAHPEPSVASSLFGLASGAKNIASWAAGLVLVGVVVLLLARTTRDRWRASRGGVGAVRDDAGRQ